MDHTWEKQLFQVEWLQSAQIKQFPLSTAFSMSNKLTMFCLCIRSFYSFGSKCNSCKAGKKMEAWIISGLIASSERASIIMECIKIEIVDYISEF